MAQTQINSPLLSGSVGLRPCLSEDHHAFLLVLRQLVPHTVNRLHAGFFASQNHRQVTVLLLHFRRFGHVKQLFVGELQFVADQLEYVLGGFPCPANDSTHVLVSNFNLFGEVSYADTPILHGGSDSVAQPRCLHLMFGSRSSLHRLLSSQRYSAAHGRHRFSHPESPRSHLSPLSAPAHRSASVP